MYELITENNTKFYVMKEREIKKTDSVFYNLAVEQFKTLTSLFSVLPNNQL